MARGTKPAETKPANTKQPATEQPAKVEDKGVGIPEMAKLLGRTEKGTRSAIRRVLGGPQVGRGGRYRWDSTEDPEFVALLAKLTPKTNEEAE
jgi:hypothetical protein